MNVHRSFTMCAQVFHNHGKLGHNTSVRTLIQAGIVVVLLVLTSAAHAQSAPSARPAVDTFRIFLREGRVLSSYGEFAQVDTDLVFVVAQGQKGLVETHDLMTIPVAAVDMARTSAYAVAVRKAEYALNRGEKEYQSFVTDISKAVAALEASDDRDRRLGIAMVARKRLLSWSEDHFGYRAADVRQLASIMDEVVLELQAASGVSHFSIELIASVAPPPPIPLLPALTPVETVSMALVAALATDVGVEKLALLRSASRVADSLPEAGDSLRLEVARLLADEIRVDAAYRTLLRAALTRADGAVRQGRPAVIRRLILDVEREDADLGRRRPRDVAPVIRRLWSESGLAVDQKNAFDRWALVKDQLRAYDTRLRGAQQVWSRHTSTLTLIRSGQRANRDHLDAAMREFTELAQALKEWVPPAELEEVHGIFQSAVQFARQGLELGQRLSVAANLDISRNASSAIAGAELLRKRGVASLATAIEPRRVR